jgi:hypothetical protein
MAMVETHCDRCGAHIRLAATDLKAWTHVGDGISAMYAFVCPRCDEPTARRAGAPQLEVLAALGIHVDAAGPSDDLAPRHPERLDPAAPAWRPDDLLAFHELLQSDGWFDVLVNPSTVSEP